MFDTFSSTQRALLLDLRKPLLPIVLALALCLAAFVAWGVLVRLPVFVVATQATVVEAGLISAAVAPDAGVQIGQRALIRPVGRARDSLPATVIDVNATQVTILVNDLDSWWAFIVGRQRQIEEVAIVVARRAPFGLLLWGGE